MLSDYNLPKSLSGNFRLDIPPEEKVDLSIMILFVVESKRNDDASLLTVKVTLEYMKVFFA